jgi:predicted RNA-binding protein with PIN domain
MTDAGPHPRPDPDPDPDPDPGRAGTPAPGPARVATRLPEGVRLRVVALTADRLGTLPTEAVPPSLRRVARFAPAKRARLGGVAIAAALESDPDFRGRIGDAVREALPDLAAALAAGSQLPALPIEETAAAAYLLRSDGWHMLIVEAAAAAEAADSAASQSASATVVSRLQEQLGALRAERRAETERLRAEVGVARAEASDLRRRLGETRERARLAEAQTSLLSAEAELDRTRSAAAVSVADTEVRRLRTKLAEAESALEGVRRTAREGRGTADIRLRMLLDTVVEAATGLRRELALPPTTERPADAIAAEMAASANVVSDDLVAARGLDPDDPAVIEEMLALPRVHLIVDGYNVTKTGYGGLPLEAQRSRLVASLAGLAARTGAEVTVVFDGNEVAGVRVQTPRGVRMLFSLPEETADDRIRLLADAEPPGRPVVVVSSDREVADGVRRSGVRPVSSAGLLRVLGRG